jgi:uracil-DNA glycosylase family 4
MFIGEAPGRLGADQTGVPFTRDRSGLLFRRVLSQLISRSPVPFSVYVTNAVKCLPADLGGCNRTPSSEEIRSCRRHLDQEIAAVRPHVIVPLGRTAAQVILGSQEVTWWTATGGSPVIFPAKHPAYVVRGGGRERLTEDEYLDRLTPLLDLLSPLIVAG